MSEPRPYAMVIMAVFGIISAFIYARQPSPEVVAQGNPAATAVQPSFPAVVYPGFARPPDSNPLPPAAVPPMTGAPPIPRTLPGNFAPPPIPPPGVIAGQAQIPQPPAQPQPSPAIQVPVLTNKMITIPVQTAVPMPPPQNK